MKKFIAPLCIAAGVVASATSTSAAPPPTASHYPPGAEGIKAGTLPPPGFYFRDYNFFYTADKFDGVDDFDVFAYANAPRLVWISDFKIFGANYGADIIIPFGYTGINAAGASFHEFGLADIEVEPLLLSWHFDKFDLSAGYAFWAPTGTSDDFNPATPGLGFWSHMLTFGGTYYFDQEKTWAVSLLNRYEFNHDYDWAGLDVTPGQVLTMEWGLSKSLTKFIDVGLIGYYQQQTTQTSVDEVGDVDNAYVVGLGPEISAVCPKLGLISSLRYNYELAAENRPEGHRVTLTLTYRF
jgi:hypothetical protein